MLTSGGDSPGMNAAWPWLPELFGGRQSARTFHFLSASLIVLFVMASDFLRYWTIRLPFKSPGSESGKV